MKRGFTNKLPPKTRRIEGNLCAVNVTKTHFSQWTVKFVPKTRYWARYPTSPMWIIDEVFACELNKVRVTDENAKKKRQNSPILP